MSSNRSDHTALKSVIISDNPSRVSWRCMIARLYDSCYLQSLLFRRFPCVSPLPRHQQVIVIMNSEIIGLIHVGFMLCFERRSQYNSLTEWFTKSIQQQNILVSLHSSVYYLQKLFAAFLIILVIYSRYRYSYTLIRTLSTYQNSDIFFISWVKMYHLQHKVCE